MALHSASDFIFTTGDDLAAIKYPADGETRPDLPAKALCGYDLAYLTESILWRYPDNWDAARSQTFTLGFSRSVSAAQLANVAYWLDFIVANASSRPLSSSAITSKVVASISSADDFAAAYPELLLDVSTLPHKSAVKPASGDPLTRTYLAALESSLAAFDSVAYAGRLAYADFKAALAVLSASGTHTDADYDFYVKSGVGYLQECFGYVSWATWKGPDYSTDPSDGTVKVGFADATIFSRVTAASATPPISQVVEVVPVTVTNRVYKAKFDGGLGTVVADVDQTFHAWIPLVYVAESGNPGAFVLKGGQLTLESVRALFGVEIVDVADGIKQDEYGYTGYQVVKLQFATATKTVVTFKDL